MKSIEQNGVLDNNFWLVMELSNGGNFKYCNQLQPQTSSLQVTMYKTNTKEVKFWGLDVEEIDRLHGIQVCTEFNKKAAPHPIVPEPLKLKFVSGLANSSAHLPHTTTLLTFSFGLHWSWPGALLANSSLITLVVWIFFLSPLLA